MSGSARCFHPCLGTSAGQGIKGSYRTLIIPLFSFRHFARLSEGEFYVNIRFSIF
jgi:hypothetical protein